MFRRLGQAGRAWLLAAIVLPAIGLGTIVTAQTVTTIAIPPGFDFNGTWNCAGAFRGGTAHTSTYSGTVTSGSWLELKEVDQAPPSGYMATYLIGYDPRHHRFIEFDASNSSAGTYSSTAGWVGGKLTLESEPLNDSTLRYGRDRFVYGTTSRQTFTVDWQVQKSGATEWLEGDHLECRRPL